jgi:molybdopterin molybdotransferase
MKADPRPFFDVRMRGFRVCTEVSEALRLIDDRVRALPSESVNLAEATGRVLAQAVVSTVDVPGFPRAAMDGYALRGEDTFGASTYNPLRLQIVGESLPARPCVTTVIAGSAVCIMTGAPVPAGADAVLPAESADEDNGTLIVTEPISPGRHVGRIGEDVHAGSQVLTAGRRLRPQDAGLLASIGVARVAVFSQPRVAILITGDELLAPGSAPDGYRIVDSNSVTLNALVRRDGGMPMPTEYLRDDANAIRHALSSQDADVILISGGSSVGREDHAPRLLAELGELPVHGMALRPASPTGIGFLRDRPVFLLPGNPVSCLCAYDLFAGRAVRIVGGRSTELPYRSEELPLARKIVSAVGRVDYVRVRITPAGIEPLAVSGASMLSTTVAADGFVLVERDREGHAAGERVRVYRYDDVAS